VSVADEREALVRRYWPFSSFMPGVLEKFKLPDRYQPL
jgi:hypothetical protein